MVDGVAIVHNGIIENHRELRNDLKAAGAHFATETNSEVVAHLVSRERKNGYEPVAAVRKVLPRLSGTFALAFLFEGHDNLLIGARKGSPLAVGYGCGEMFLGSDAMALAPLTDIVAYLEDGDLAVVTREQIEFIDVNGARLRYVTKIAGAALIVHKGEHRHFMAKEIHEQPKVVGQTLAQYIAPDGRIRLPAGVDVDFGTVDRVSIVACGTSFYAGLIAKYWFERYAKLPVEIDIASEFRYRDVPFGAGDLALRVRNPAKQRHARCWSSPRPTGRVIFCRQRANLDDGSFEPHRNAHIGRSGNRGRIDKGVHLSAGNLALHCNRCRS